MPRVHVTIKSSRGQERRCITCGEVIKPGEKYHHWSFRYGGQRFTCYRHYPKRSQLTQSKLSGVYAAIETAEEALPNATSVEEVKELIETAAGEIESVKDEYNDAAEAMGAAGEAGTSREMADELEGFVDMLNSWEPSVEDPEDEETEDSIRLQAEKEFIVKEMPPHVADEYGITGEDADVLDDPIARMKILHAFMDDEQAFSDYVEQRAQEWREEHEGDDPVATAREEAQEVLNECPV